MKHIVFDHDGTLVNTRSKPLLFSGIKKLLIELLGQDVKIYIWTARDRHSTVEILKSLEIISFFEDISTASDGEPKPNVQGLLCMLDGVAKKDIVMVGDSISDIVGAKKFSINSVGVLWDHLGSGGYEYLKRENADYICKTVKECRDVLFKWIKES